jgi:hypothetical protein
MLFSRTQSLGEVTRKQLDDPRKQPASIAPPLRVLENIRTRHQARDIVGILGENVVEDGYSAGMVLGREQVHKRGRQHDMKRLPDPVDPVRVSSSRGTVRKSHELSLLPLLFSAFRTSDSPVSQALMQLS